jgi:tetratricopeptide (TPR) repeat protein
VLLGLLAYSNTFHVPFLFDDKQNIINNPVMRELGSFLDPEAFPKIGMRYVGFFTFALNYTLHGLNVTGYHILNIAIHLINAILVYVLVQLTFRTPQMRGIDPGSRFSDGVAVFSALLFVSHPVQTQAVTYIVQRFASLATLFYLFSLTMYVMARLRQMPVQTIPADAQCTPEADKGKGKAHLKASRKAKVKGKDKVKAKTKVKAKARAKAGDDASVKTQREVRASELSTRSPALAVILYALSIISAIMAMKTKEIAFTLPVVITLYEFFFFEGRWKKRILYLVPLLLTIFIIPLSLIGIDKPLSEVMYDVGEATRTQSSLSRWEYLMTQFRVIVTYLRLLVLPVNQNLDYAYSTYHSFHSFLDPEIFFSFLVLLLIFCLGVYLFSRSRAGGSSIRLASFGIFWFFITLSVESSIIPIKDVIFEHRVYLPSVGAFIGITTLAFYLAGRLERRWPHIEKALVTVLALIVIVLTGTTYARNRVWRDPVTLWEDVLRKSPQNYMPHFNLGFYYQEKGLIDKAIERYLTAINLNPDHVKAHNNLGLAYQSKGLTDRAIEQYKTVIKLNPDDVKAHNNLGLAYWSKGLTDRAIEQYKTVIKLNPDDVKAHNNLGLAYQSKGLTDRAIEQYKTVIKINPDLPEVYFNLGLAYRSKGLTDKAIEQYKTIIKRHPDYTDAYNNLGLAYQSKGLTDRAIEQYQTAIKLNPNMTQPYYNLGLAYQSKGLTDKAIESYRACLRIKPDWEKPHYNLGYIYYKKGDIEQARREFERVLEINPEDQKARKFLSSMIK